MTSASSRVYIGLGSNLENPEQQLRQALATLSQLPDIELMKVSSFYRSSALTLPGSPPQEDYVNATAFLSTLLGPQQLLKQLHEIETMQGRERIAKWAPRTLDLDILLFDDLQLKSKELTVPHPLMTQRNFVIHPLYEIAGPLQIPGVGSLAELAAKLSWEGLQRLE